jgi:hypothetical protein
MQPIGRHRHSVDDAATPTTFRAPWRDARPQERRSEGSIVSRLVPSVHAVSALAIALLLAACSSSSSGGIGSPGGLGAFGGANSSGGGLGDTLSFHPPAHYPAPNLYATAVGDFDGDGAKDVALVSWSGVAIAFGVGDGTFGSPVSVATSRVLRPVSVDANGDGNDDLFYADLNNAVDIRFGQRDRTLSPPIQLTTAPLAGIFFLADIDGDGAIDIVRPDSASQTGLTYLAPGAASVRDEFVFVGMGAGFATDLDRDGTADLVGDGTDVALIGADGRPHTFETYPMPAEANGLGVWGIDINGDGILDPFTSTRSGVTFTQFPNSDGSLRPAVVGSWTSFCANEDVLVLGQGDLSGDGFTDVIESYDCPSESGQLGMAALLGDGAGSFRDAGVTFGDLQRGSNANAAIADLNADGKNDVVFGDMDSFVVLLQR